eukprot:CAMPEP_0172787754 /NCGR_PEP_ID=MMETSP1074-20121228/206610_1 /TAXON_ID=2916 /ORGANISM="Ceratium fusus, Strain PA161109" /LENGTH=197 /DNA_ID=CAMNT_0013624775 /DNA_START=391 /DNA_END=984 /DNA_ORIENTATION=+
MSQNWQKLSLGQWRISDVHWAERARHTLLLLRLQRPYLAYCIICSLLATIAFVSTAFDLHHRGISLQTPRHWQDVLEGGTWQSACWTVVGLALCAELFSEIIIRWRPEAACFAHASAGVEPWCVFDATVVALTVLAWGIMRVRKSSLVREEAEEADLWLLAIRFALQPCRVLATARMARQAQQMQKSNLEVTLPCDV